MFEITLFSAIVTFIWFNLLFIVATIKQDNSVVDIGWGLGFVLLAWLNLIFFGGNQAHQYLMAGLVTVWGVRLAVHIYLRNKDRGEDWRYAAWRKAWGKWLILRSYLQVFMLQAVFMLTISLPVIFSVSAANLFRPWLLAVGVVVWASGWLLESLADYHLQLHINSQSKKLLTSGVWGISRHPNYFGEAVLWWGIGLIAVASIPHTPASEPWCAWYVLVGPLAITLLIRYVSGVSLLEKKMVKRADFKQYSKQVPIFVPWPWRIKK